MRVIRFTSVLLASASLLPTAAKAQTVLVSANTTGGVGNAESRGSALSTDGRWVALTSNATDLVAGDTNSTRDVFLRDRLTGTTTRVSVNSAGAQANNLSGHVSLSADGQFIAFMSLATNLVTGDTNNSADIFVHDRQTAQTTRVSISSSGVQSNADSEHPCISADGRFVAFTSQAGNLVTGDTNGFKDIFVHDRQTGTTSRVSVSSSGVQANSNSAWSCISADGGKIAFESGATNLLGGGGDTNGVADVFLHDRNTGQTTRVSVATGGTEGNDRSGFASITADGGRVAFMSFASNLIAADTNGNPDAFVHSVASGSTERVSLTAAGGQATFGTSSLDGPSISAGGAYVAFTSYSSDIVPGDTNSSADIFVRDLATSQTTRQNVDSSGNQSNFSTCQWPKLSSSGRYLAFESTASNLVAGDTNAAYDVFLRDRGDINPLTYCTAGTSTFGCAATMGWALSTGDCPSVSAGSGSFFVTCSGADGQKDGVIFYGVSGRDATPWALGSTSFLCVKAPTQRTANANSGGTMGACDGSYSLDFFAWLAGNPGTLGAPAMVGNQFNFQAWYRDPPAPKTTSLSDGLECFIAP